MCTLAMLIWAIFHPAGERVFLVPSTSMAPTLILGDRAVMVPYAPGTDPARGDIVAFTPPGDPFTVYTFRVIGLAGDTVEMVDGTVVLNGMPIERTPAGAVAIDFGFETVDGDGWRETLPEGHSYRIADTDPNGFLDNTAEVVVPDGHYFVLGDNRDNAADSRLAERVGMVPRPVILGRMDRVLASCSDDGLFRADRTGLAIGP